MKIKRKEGRESSSFFAAFSGGRYRPPRALRRAHKKRALAYGDRAISYDNTRRFVLRTLAALQKFATRLCCSFLLGCQKLSPIGVQARILWRKISPSARLATRSQKTRTCIASCFALSQCKRSFFVSVTHARAAPAPRARLAACTDMVTGRYHKNLQNALKLYILCS